jgi:predicted signal transduction protein with EAL and GGDEF domain
VIEPRIPTYQATIYVAGDLATARAFLRDEAYERWLCVSLTPTEFVFTGAVETGMAIGFVNYPEVRSSAEKIFERAKDIATRLIQKLGQRTALVVGTDHTEWISLQPPGAYP